MRHSSGIFKENVSVKEKEVCLWTELSPEGSRTGAGLQTCTSLCQKVKVLALCPNLLLKQVSCSLLTQDFFFFFLSSFLVSVAALFWFVFLKVDTEPPENF